MKLTSEHLNSLHELYIAHLKKALDMEREITKALPTMVEKPPHPIWQMHSVPTSRNPKDTF
jgi:hypothetical protein